MRAVWDRLQANKGTFIDLKDLEPEGTYTLNHIRLSLTDTWGLDILYNQGPGRGLWCLIGEWKGSKYIDYLGPRIKNEKL